MARPLPVPPATPAWPGRYYGPPGRATRAGAGPAGAAAPEPRRRYTGAIACSHLALARDPPARTPAGCEECLGSGGRWVELRVCRLCGHVGCCDSSPGKHATGHFRSTGHPLMRSFQPGQGWSWCYLHEEMVG